MLYCLPVQVYLYPLDIIFTNSHCFYFCFRYFHIIYIFLCSSGLLLFGSSSSQSAVSTRSSGYSISSCGSCQLNLSIHFFQRHSFIMFTLRNNNSNFSILLTLQVHLTSVSRFIRSSTSASVCFAHRF